MGGKTVKKPSLLSLLIGLVPFIGACFTVPLWDRVQPMVCGLPFNFFWLISWILLTPLCMWAAYRIEVSRNPETPARGQEDAP
jgi:hypothetical protein